MMSSVAKVLAIAKNEVGYHESGNNYTKYAEEIDRTAFNNGAKNGYPWCAVFIEWLFYKAFGERTAMRMLNLPNGSCAAGCNEFSQYFIGGNNFFRNVPPSPGDVIFFYVGKEINHVGIVERVEEAVIYTIEGNSGDGVRRNSYIANHASIAGYGRPKWELVEEGQEQTEEQTEEPIAEKPRRNYLCLQKGDGMNNPLDSVRALQNHLRVWGYTLDADGEFWDITEATVKDFQRRVGLPDNGIVTELEWKELIFVEE